jgi:hypothetical protein
MKKKKTEEEKEKKKGEGKEKEGEGEEGEEGEEKGKEEGGGEEEEKDSVQESTVVNIKTGATQNSPFCLKSYSIANSNSTANSMNTNLGIPKQKNNKSDLNSILKTCSSGIMYFCITYHTFRL